MNKPSYPAFYWINEESRLYLARGYIENGQSVESRIEEIASAAEKILSIDGFAKKFSEYMSYGWYSLSSPIWSNFGKERALPISCVTSDTWINTKDDGGKMAKDVKIGDLVLTHKGRYRSITDIIITKNRKNIFKLKVSGRMTPLYITENHQVLTNLGWVRVDQLNENIHLVAINGDIEIEETDYTLDLKQYCKKYTPYIVDGKICKKISENTKNPSTINSDFVTYLANVNEKVEIDAELAWAFGFWFAEGSISIDKHKNPNGVRVTYNDKDEVEIGKKWLDIITKKFNVNGNSYVSKVQRNGKLNSWINSNVNSHILGNLFESFGRGCKNKLIPKWIINLPKEKLQCFLDGILCGDGYTTKLDDCRIAVANPKMLLQIYQIGLKLGLQMSLQMQEKAGKLSTTSHVYVCRFKKYKLGVEKYSGNSAVKFNDGLFYAPIKELCLTQKQEDVYDFTVEEDHSFSAAGVVLHNCFGSYVPDTTNSILEKASEVGIMSKMGGGTSGYFGSIRPRGSEISTGGKTDGPVRFMEIFETITNVISQGGVRRGSFAAYLPVEHPDILEFLRIRGDGHVIQNMSIGVTITDEWMKSMIDGDKDKRDIWAKIIQKRFETGYPYITFIDNVNNNAPKVYKDLGRKIVAQNLCNEIALSSTEDESFVCNLSSMNILHYDTWKNTDAVKTLTYFLDAVMTEFIEKASKISHMEAPTNFAKRQRALGIGTLGWHSYLQENMIPFESFNAKQINITVHKHVYEESQKASKEMAVMYGEPEMLKGYGLRNVTTVAIAPTTSSAFILGQVSPSIEPLNSNYFVKALAKGKFTYKNPHLVALLVKRGKDTPDVWNSILTRGGSVQHLEFLDQDEKDVFKTFGELSQKEILIQAAARQKWIDQGQSLNIMIPPKTSPKEVSQLMIFAWESGIKGLYYQRSANPAQELARNIMNCTSCSA